MSVAVDGDLVVVGQNIRHDSNYRSLGGVAYVFNAASGALVATLTDPTGGTDNSFGYSVAISGHLAVVGAYASDNPTAPRGGEQAAGQAYVFDVNAGATPAPLATLSSPTLRTGDKFGFSVAIDGHLAVVGAQSAGQAYAFDVTAGPTPAVLATLNNPDRTGQDRFGYSVAISGHLAVVGAAEASPGGVANTGAAYVFDVTAGAAPAPAVTLRNPDPAAYDRFGAAVAVSGTTAVVGAPNVKVGEVQYAGTAYLFDLAAGSAPAPLASLTSPQYRFNNKTTYYQADQFGGSAAISDNLVVIGTKSDFAGHGGGAYVFDVTNRSAPTVAARPTLPAPDANAHIGYSVAVSGTRVVVGAADVGGSNSNRQVYGFGGSAVALPVTIGPDNALLPAGQVGVAYPPLTLTASGPPGPYTFAFDATTEGVGDTRNELPAGLTLAADGTISGTPTEATLGVFIVRATAADGTTGIHSYFLPVGAAPTPTPDPAPTPTPEPTVPPAVPPAAPTVVAGMVGGKPVVDLVDAAGAVSGTLPLPADFAGPVRAAAYLRGRAAAVAVGSGPGSPSLVVVLDAATGGELFRVRPFEATFAGGTQVAAGELAAGRPVFVVTAGDGGSGRTQVYDGTTFAKLADFFGLDDQAFRGGARAAVGDLTGAGTADLIVAAGFGGGPRVAVYDGSSLAAAAPRKRVPDFFVFEETLRNGVFVAGGDLTGDGAVEVIVGGGPRRRPPGVRPRRPGADRRPARDGGQLLRRRPECPRRGAGGGAAGRRRQAAARHRQRGERAGEGAGVHRRRGAGGVRPGARADPVRRGGAARRGVRRLTAGRRFDGPTRRPAGSCLSDRVL